MSDHPRLAWVSIETVTAESKRMRETDPEVWAAWVAFCKKHGIATWPRCDDCTCQPQDGEATEQVSEDNPTEEDPTAVQNAKHWPDGWVAPSVGLVTVVELVSRLTPVLASV